MTANDPFTRRDSSPTMTRRSALRMFAGAGAALVAVAAGGSAVLASHTSKQYTVTANANFRTGPSTSYAIISVITKGATFTLNGQTQNGYAGVTYNGRSGWVLASLVIEAAAVADPVISGVGYTTAAVNLRTGPGTSYQILRVVPKDAKIGTSTTERNGFLYVSHNGLAGWMSMAYIAFRDAPSGETFTTTANLNLRAQPSTSAKVLLVMPSGSTVQAASGTAPGWRQVVYKGTTGWAATPYLN